jgi:hypothetical protein
MSDEKPDPLSDVIRGLGLLLRAAKTTVERVPKKGLEEAVLETAREVGRAIENVAGAVAGTVEREVFGRKDAPPQRQERQQGQQGGERNRDDAAKPPNEPPKPPDAS